MMAENNKCDHNGQENTPELKASAELGVYKRKPAMSINKEDGSFTNPLDWWRIKEQQFPLLAKLAIQLLAKPTTSAPSERVFSTAGLTISKLRSRLDPTVANELVFLHDTLPALRGFNSTNANKY